MSNIDSPVLTREMVKEINKPKNLVFKSVSDLESVVNKVPLGCQVTRLEENLIAIEDEETIEVLITKLIKLDNTQDDEGLFENTEFKSIDFHNVDTSEVTDMRRMFYSHEAQSLDLSSFNTSNVTDMSWMFYDCKVQSLDLSSFDTSNVTNMGGMFSNFS